MVGTQMNWKVEWHWGVYYTSRYLDFFLWRLPLKIRVLSAVTLAINDDDAHCITSNVNKRMGPIILLFFCLLTRHPVTCHTIQIKHFIAIHFLILMKRSRLRRKDNTLLFVYERIRLCYVVKCSWANLACFFSSRYLDI